MNRDNLISDWPCSWEEHELVELREGMKRPLREKLLWLEAMTEFARKIQGAGQVKESSPPYRGAADCAE